MSVIEITLYGAKQKGELILGSVKETEKEVMKLLKQRETWSNCFDQEFSVTKKEIYEKYNIVKLSLVECYEDV